MTWNFNLYTNHKKKPSGSWIPDEAETNSLFWYVYRLRFPLEISILQIHIGALENISKRNKEMEGESWAHAGRHLSPHHVCGHRQFCKPSRGVAENRCVAWWEIATSLTPQQTLKCYKLRYTCKIWNIINLAERTLQFSRSYLRPPALSVCGVKCKEPQASWRHINGRRTCVFPGDNRKELNKAFRGLLVLFICPLPHFHNIDL